MKHEKCLDYHPEFEIVDRFDHENFKLTTCSRMNSNFSCDADQIMVTDSYTSKCLSYLKVKNNDGHITIIVGVANCGASTRQACNIANLHSTSSINFSSESSLCFTGLCK